MNGCVIKRWQGSRLEQNVKLMKGKTVSSGSGIRLKNNRHNEIGRLIYVKRKG
jgi:hypothetical protein